jgi:subtilase family serine protease
MFWPRWPLPRSGGLFVIIGHAGRPTLGAVSVAVVALAAATLAPATAAAGAGSTHSRTGLRSSHPSWVKGSNRDRTLPDAAQVSARVYLAPRDAAALDAAVQAVSTPGSASYRHYVTPGAFTAQFGPTRAATRSVSQWLRGAGLKVTSVSAGRYLSVTGTAAQANKAFGTTLAYYRKDGKLRRAATDALSAPAAVASQILGVTGLTQSSVRMKPTTVPPEPGFRNARPCSAYYGEKLASTQLDGTPLPQFQGTTLPYAVCGYTPAQLRTAYGVDNPAAGKGVTVGIIDAYASPNIGHDANTYARRHAGKPFTPGQLTQTRPAAFTLEGPDDCDAAGWYGEETLDVEAVHGMAPAANIHYYAAASCNDPDFNDTVAQVLVDNDVDIVSNSYGVTEEEWAAEPTVRLVFDLLMKQAAMQGITFNFSSGDDGDELANTGVLQADASADSPWVTSVGGTALAVGQDGQRLFETGWGTEKFSPSADGSSWDAVGYLYGSGGGYSTLYPRPWYQNGVVPDNGAGRAEPDVAMDADPTTGMLIGETQTFPTGAKYGEYRIGGTSLACPLFSGVEAQAVATSGRLGLANPMIYGMAKRRTGVYTDITAGQPDLGNVRVDFANGVNHEGGYLYSIRTFNQDSSLLTAPGWDDVTGLGAPTSEFVRVLGNAG